MNYPLISEYIDAIKLAEENFVQLKNLRPVLDDDGNPVMTSGNFAVVFKMKDINKGNYVALKCFTREQPGRGEAYKLITEELSAINLNNPNWTRNYLVNIKYYDQELFVDSKKSNSSEFPVLTMDWVEGVTLDKYVRKIVLSEGFNMYSVADLKRLALDFLDFAYWMCSQEIAHGDIKPDNIIITKKDGIVLVDYDGMYVPKMHGQFARENGSPNYRHPNRNIKCFDSTIDNFSLSVIAFSLAAIAINKDVYNQENENALVLSEENFRDIFNPKLLSKLSLVLHDKICSSLYSSILMQLSNTNSQIDINSIFNLKNYIDVKPPIYLPYKLGDNAFQVYSTIEGTCASNHIFSDIHIIDDEPDNTLMILSYGGEIDYTSLDDFNCAMRVTDLILFEERQKRPKANMFALLSNNTNINNLRWYKLIKPISKSLFLAKNDDDKYGIISDEKIILPFKYESIKPIRQEHYFYFLCKTTNRANCLFLLTEDKTLAKAIDGEFNDDCWHYGNGASAPPNLVIFYNLSWKGYDLERACPIVLPPKIKRIKSYSEQILCVETWDSEEGVRLFDVDKGTFINENIYLTVGFFRDELHPFNNGHTICETKLHKNVIVFKDGTSFVIPFEKYRLKLDEGCKYVYYNEVVLEGKSTSGKGYDIEFTIFDYRNKELHTFVYNWTTYGIRAISLEKDAYIDISSHNMKYNLTTHVVTLDLKGNPIETGKNMNENKKNINSDACELIRFENGMMLEHYIYSTFVNSKYIRDASKYLSDYGIECDVKNGYAVIRGIKDVDPEFGVYYDFIGYADMNRCYWKF